MRQETMGFGMQWHQLDHMQTICTSLQTDNHTITPSLSVYRPDAHNGDSQEKQTETETYTLTISQISQTTEPTEL